MSAYNMTKGGVRLFTKSVAHECGVLRNGVRVNSVHPGVINTPMVVAELPKWTAVGFGANDAETLKTVLGMQPIGRLGEVDDVANVHPSTLAAFVREKLREGEELPLDLFGVHRQRIAKIEV